MSNRTVGTVVRTCPGGFGFLITEAGDAFFHASQLPAEMPFDESLGRRFDFAMESENGKLRASDLYEFTGGERLTGTVGLIPPGRDFGFIRRPGQKELFFHRSDVRGDFASINEKSVSFEIQQTPRGPRAACVELMP